MNNDLMGDASTRKDEERKLELSTLVNLPDRPSSNSSEISVVDAPYGYCPTCGAKGVARERRLDGNDVCANKHTYPSRYARGTDQCVNDSVFDASWNAVMDLPADIRARLSIHQIRTIIRTIVAVTQPVPVSGNGVEIPLGYGNAKLFSIIFKAPDGERLEILAKEFYDVD